VTRWSAVHADIASPLLRLTPCTPAKVVGGALFLIANRFPAARTPHCPLLACPVAVWSLGATLYCCAFGYSPFECTRTEDGKLRLADCSHVRVLGPVYFPVGHNYSHAFCDLILWMLTKDPEARPGIDEVIARLEAMAVGAGGSGGSRGVSSGVEGAGAAAARPSSGMGGASNVPSAGTGERHGGVVL
jgi:hypothetical protein